MATNGGITKACVALSMVWPGRMEKLAGPEGSMMLAAIFRETSDEDLGRAVVMLVTDVPKLYPDDNPVAMLLDACKHLARERKDAERKQEERRKAEADEAAQLREWIREPTAEEVAMLDQELPAEEYAARLHRRRCADTRKRLETTREAREQIAKRLEAIEADQPRRIA